ncbi:hypothetical protein A6V39_00220 [Candidatus Mycoplasma haematobovis]|uniref:Uncharacterized protein n=1 Tax=Candidatus Mycoplasma haematobovis TaxID=432608 RepID=A0A1A9QEC0_9MOLU|nr:hypothetical protein [Candidatus Mycoplasma haematobovis]OAL10474.1 hypothetical protein A6V39_00220 [Candidatus Mycoplasma haematobovis]
MAIKPVLLTALTAGTVGGGATGVYFLLKPDAPVAKPKTKTLKEVMGTNGFEALDTEGNTDNDTWKKLIAKYTADSTAVEVAKIAITGEIEKSPSDDHVANIDKFKKACKNLLEKTEGYDGDKVTVINWCNKQSKLISDS